MKGTTRRVVVPLFGATLAFSVFVRNPGSRNVPAIQIAVLVAIGFCLGVAFANLMNWIRLRSAQ